MRITNEDTQPGDTISTPDDGEFEADETGHFEVPRHVGIERLAFPGWSQFTGEVKKLAGEVTAEGDRLAHAAHDRIDKLETDLADALGKVKDLEASIAKKVAAEVAKVLKTKPAPKADTKPADDTKPAETPAA